MSSLSQKLKNSSLSYAVCRLYLKFVPDRTQTFLFVATTGRSGTDSLSTILGTIPDCASFHEPHPRMTEHAPAGLNRMAVERRRFIRQKLPSIRLAARSCRHYAETNHQFIKRFAEPAIEAFGERIRILHLVRDPLAVATSFYAIDSIPGLTNKGRKYLLDPFAPDNVIAVQDLLRKPDFSHEFHRCLWYWYEIEARVHRLRARFPHVRWHSLRTGELNDIGALRQMHAALDLPVGSDLERVVGTRGNTKAGKKIRTLDRALAERMHFQFRDELTRRFGTEFWTRPSVLPSGGLVSHPLAALRSAAPPLVVPCPVASEPDSAPPTLYP